MGSATGTGGAALFLALSALGATLAASTQGYRALTGEEVALTVTTLPTGPRAFQALVEFPDGRDTTFIVQGDQVLVDAHILKWHYLANVLGLRTQYELDRLTGRYRDMESERQLDRTVHSLKSGYGSATYVEVDEPARFEVLVSTTGLLARRIELP
jgi:hypothetical protein